MELASVTMLRWCPTFYLHIIDFYFSRLWIAKRWQSIIRYF